jgi:hypothetical protein
VLGLFVPPQIHLPLEGSPAEVARERLEPSVLPRVGDEVRRLTERLAADGTLVRLFPCNKKRKESIRTKLEMRNRSIWGYGFGNLEGSIERCSSINARVLYGFADFIFLLFIEWPRLPYDSRISSFLFISPAIASVFYLAREYGARFL